MAELSKQLVDAMKQSAESKTSAFDSIGTVRRVKEGIAYVHLAGGVDETPVQLTVDAKTGDEVQVRVSGGRAWIVGNATAPPTDNTMAKQAINYSKIANDAAQRATKDALVANEAAQSARESADEAQRTAESVEGIARHAEEVAEGVEAIAQQASTDAGIAKSAADSAMKGLGQVEDVVGTLNWITEHSKVTTDTTPQAGKSYYTKNQDNTFTLVTDVEGKNPAQEGWYELTEAVQNYILSHLVLTDEGLYVMKDGSQWKVLAADEGVYILDSNNKPINQMIGTGNIIGYEDETHAEIDYHSLQLIARGETTPYFWVSDLRDKDDNYQVTITETFTADGATKTFRVQLDVSAEVSATDDSHSSNTATRSGKAYTFATRPSIGATVTIVYKTASELAKAYTLGRRANGVVGAMSIAEGNGTIASGYASHAEGESKAIGRLSHSEGGGRAVGKMSHAEGNGRAEGNYTHAEGNGTRAISDYSHVEGYDTRAYTGEASHAEGQSTEAIGDASHAEGYDTEARGDYSHAEGDDTKALGESSHAQNKGTIAGHEAQTVIGKYNDNQQNNAFEIGNGTDDNNRSNAFEVDWSGNVNASGDIEDGQGNVLSNKADESSLAAVATSGSYNDLSNKPTIPPAPTDYIVSTGTTSGWSWRKWKSGRMEAEKEVSTGSTWTSVAAGFYYNQVTITPPSGMLFRHGYAVPTVASNWLTGAQVQGKDSTVKLTIHRLSGSSATFTYRVVLVGVAS